jgi:hypothetical protein
MSKILQVNPKLFEFSSRRRSRKRTEDEDGEKRTGGEIRVRAPTVPKRPTLSNRNAILKFIRDHQRRNEEGGRGGSGGGATSLSDTDTDTSDFNDSLNYLIDIAKQVEESSTQAQAPVADRRQLWSSAIVPASSNPSVARAHNHTLKSYSADYGGVSPYAQQYANIAPDPHVSTVYPDVLSAGGTMRLEPPKYGCLKGGTLPTYRTYYQLNTPHVTSMTPRHHPLTSPAHDVASHHHNVTQRRDMGSFAAAPARVTDLVETSRSAAVPPKLVFPKQKRTVRRTFKIGKSKVHPRVSVLISNRNIRRNITTKVHDLKQVSIPEIKRFLIKRGLIRVGTAAPNDVLRKMYESATMLCGDVYNHNPDTLLYNFFNDDTAVPP